MVHASGPDTPDASGPDTPEGDDRVPIGGVKIFIMVMGGLRLV